MAVENRSGLQLRCEVSYISFLVRAAVGRTLVAVVAGAPGEYLLDRGIVWGALVGALVGPTAYWAWPKKNN